MYYGREDIRIDEVPEPTAPGSGDVLVEVSRASICGTDVTEYLSGPVQIPLNRRHVASGHQGPLVLGHEFAGRVVAVGSSVEEIRPGLRVGLGAGVWCGVCEWCRIGRTNLCASYYTLGLQAHGGLAERVVAPARMCRPVPDELSDDHACLSQPLAVALHAVRRAHGEPGRSAIVIGVGGIGSFILAAAHAAGLGPLLVVDVSKRRLETATRIAPIQTINASDQDAKSAVLDLTDGDGAWLVIEASGSSSGLTLATRVVRRGGRILIVGMQETPQPLDLRDLALREVDMVTTVAHVCDTDLSQSLTILARSELGKLVVDRVIDLDDLVPLGIRPMVEKQTHGKVVVRTRQLEET